MLDANEWLKSELAVYGRVVGVNESTEWSDPVVQYLEMIQYSGFSGSATMAKCKPHTFVNLKQDFKV